MFAKEKELVEKLVEYLERKYQIKYITRELQSGNNIADVVYTEKIDREYILFDTYMDSYYYVKKIYNKHEVDIDELAINQKYKKDFKVFLKYLEENGYIKISKNHIEVIKKVDLATKNLVAIEAKLYDWKAGIEQAFRYKDYATKVYVALDSNNIEKVDKEIFKENNIGLLSVSEDEVKEIIKCKKEKVKKLDIQYYITDKFLKKLEFSI